MRNPLTSDDTYRTEERLADLEARVKRLTEEVRLAKYALDVERSEVERLTARVTELEGAILAFAESVPFTDHRIRRMREFSVLVDALAGEGDVDG